MTRISAETEYAERQNFERRREPDGDNRLLGKPSVSAWAIVAMLALVAVVGFGALGGRAHTSTDGLRILNSGYDATCPVVGATRPGRCQVQGSSPPEDLYLSKTGHHQDNTGNDQE